MRYLGGYVCLFLGLVMLINSCETTTNNDVAEKKTTQENVIQENTTNVKIVSLNGALTELAYDLGLGDKLVGTDITSSYPAQANKLTKLGHIRQLNIEGLLALNPTHVLIEAKDSDNPALEQLKKHPNLKVITIAVEQSLDAPIKAAEMLDNAFEEDLTTAVKALKEKHKIARERLNELETVEGKKAKVLFIYARGTKTLMVGGKNTAVAKMIALANAENAITTFDDYRALTPEALLQAAPDVILLFRSGLQSLADEASNKTATEVLLNIPALSETPAGKAKRVISMEGHYLSGFGPRVASAVYDLSVLIKKAMDS